MKDSIGYARYPPCRRPFLHPQPEDAPCRGDRDPKYVPKMRKDGHTHSPSYRVWGRETNMDMDKAASDLDTTDSPGADTQPGAPAFPFHTVWEPSTKQRSFD